MTHEKIEQITAECKQCSLWETREKAVFSRGSKDAPIMICGMVPGPDENKAGIPFIGRAGKLLDKILIEADMGDVYITNLVKCWLKPGLPLKEEWIGACLQYILAQILLVSPRVIVTLGLDASRVLANLPQESKMGSVHGRVYSYTQLSHGPKVEVIPTYHPSYLLRGGGEDHNKYPYVLEDFELAKYIIDEGE